MPIPYAATCSRRSAALATYAENRDCPRCPGNSLSPGVDGRNLPNSAARKLTEPGQRAAVARRGNGRANSGVRDRSILEKHPAYFISITGLGERNHRQHPRFLGVEIVS